MATLSDQLCELIRRTSCDLPPDVEAALRRAAAEETGRARSTLELILKNVEQARKNSVPVCQDTGTLIFQVRHGPEFSRRQLAADIESAVVEATRRNFLRPNAVHPLSGKNSGNNLGAGNPVASFCPEPEPGRLEVKLVLKGGGSENCGMQYSLPDTTLAAGRDTNGIRRCLLDAAVRAQGFGCAPGTLGVGVGGDRVTSFQESKEQLFRLLDDTHPDAELAHLEREMVEKINRLEIGPMGFGGRTTLLGTKIGIRHRHPACFFVSVSYMCWAYRRRRLVLENGRAEIS